MVCRVSLTGSTLIPFLYTELPLVVQAPGQSQSEEREQIPEQEAVSSHPVSADSCAPSIPDQPHFNLSTSQTPSTKGKGRAEDFPSFNEDSLRASTPKSAPKLSPTISGRQTSKSQTRLMKLPLDRQSKLTPQRKAMTSRAPAIQALRIVKRKKGSVNDDAPFGVPSQLASEQASPQLMRSPPAQRRRIEVEKRHRLATASSTQSVHAPRPVMNSQVGQTDPCRRTTAGPSAAQPAPSRFRSGPRRVPMDSADAGSRADARSHTDIASHARTTVVATRLPAGPSASRPVAPKKPTPASSSTLPRLKATVSSSRGTAAQQSRIARFQPTNRPTAATTGQSRIGARTYGRVPVSGSKS
jgi:hypothetical protein